MNRRTNGGRMVDRVFTTFFGHDRYFLDEVVEKMVELENRELIVYHTNFSGYLKEREERLLRNSKITKTNKRKSKRCSKPSNDCASGQCKPIRQTMPCSEKHGTRIRTDGKSKASSVNAKTNAITIR
ncbi:Nucleotide-binding protein ExpZ [Listeria monocytogenes N53-1]|nr:Nucleotide-binding protein ExpZ [Listeria monocytogenes]CCQ25471.1 Nucleotide-binding protein ExpZ [Listeria monocytogenes N53-1]